MWHNLLDSGSLTMARFKAPPSMRSNENQAYFVQDKAALQAESSNQFKWTQTWYLVKLSDICNHATFVGYRHHDKGEVSDIHHNLNCVKVLILGWLWADLQNHANP